MGGRITVTGDREGIDKIVSRLTGTQDADTNVFRYRTVTDACRDLRKVFRKFRDNLDVDSGDYISRSCKYMRFQGAVAKVEQIHEGR